VKPDRSQPVARGRAFRIVTAVAGVALLGAAVAVVNAIPQMNLSVVIAVVILCGLGIDAIVSAALKRRSLISRIGPLP